MYHTTTKILEKLWQGALQHLPFTRKLFDSRSMTCRRKEMCWRFRSSNLVQLLVIIHLVKWWPACSFIHYCIGLDWSHVLCKQFISTIYHIPITSYSRQSFGFNLTHLTWTIRIATKCACMIERKVSCVLCQWLTAVIAFSMARLHKSVLCKCLLS